MIDFLNNFYLWIKSLHILAVISWMAGLFYLPRIFVYHSERAKKGDILDTTFQIMERKLLRFIMRPAMILTWICGLLMAVIPGIIDWSMGWVWVKFVSILGMTWFQKWCADHCELFKSGNFTKTGRYYRMMNEVPTVLMIAIVFSVIVKY